MPTAPHPRPSSHHPAGPLPTGPRPPLLTSRPLVHPPAFPGASQALSPGSRGPGAGGREQGRPGGRPGPAFCLAGPRWAVSTMCSLLHLEAESSPTKAISSFETEPSRTSPGPLKTPSQRYALPTGGSSPVSPQAGRCPAGSRAQNGPVGGEVGPHTRRNPRRGHSQHTPGPAPHTHPRPRAALGPGRRQRCAGLRDTPRRFSGLPRVEVQEVGTLLRPQPKGRRDV